MDVRSVVGPALVACALAHSVPARAQQPGATTSYIIGTIAGTGVKGFWGDNGPATSAQLFSPSGLAFDALGNLYIADSGNHRIRKVTPQGVITTVAGNGTPGFSGDGSPATSAQLNSPKGLAVDRLGTVYIADTGNGRVRRVSTLGLIHTVAGIGPSASNACVADACVATAVWLGPLMAVAVAANGDLLIPGLSGLLRVSSGGVANRVSAFSQSVTAGFQGVKGIALDVGGTLYLAGLSRPSGQPHFRSCVWEVTSDGQSRQVYLGSTAITCHDSPVGVAVDAARNLHVAERMRNQIVKIWPEGTISTIAGGGGAGFSGDGQLPTLAQVSVPDGIAFDASGALHIADTGNHRVRKLIPVRLTAGCSYAVDP